MKTKKEMLTEYFPNEKHETTWFEELKYWWWGSLWWLFPNGILQENPVVFLTNPFESIPAIFRNLKWAYQRVYRGWDDTACWGVDSWLDGIMPDILEQLKKNKQGIPSAYFPENYTGDDPELERLAEENWNIDLDKMIETFKIGRQLEELPAELYVENYKKLDEEFEKGMVLFAKRYRNLWD